jgi:hypothetical protein
MEYFSDEVLDQEAIEAIFDTADADRSRYVSRNHQLTAGIGIDSGLNHCCAGNCQLLRSMVCLSLSLSLCVSDGN